MWYDMQIFRQRFLHVGLFVSLFLCLSTVTVAAPSTGGSLQGMEFPVRDGDVWVMTGDSITWQNLYTVYLEAFIRARYPKLKFVSVNSGKSGEVFIQGVIRFRDTIGAYKPTLVTVNYGMNDHTKVFPDEQDFLDKANSAPQRFVSAVQAIGARLVVCSASPLIAPADYSTDAGHYQLGQSAKVPPGWRSNPVNRLFAEKMRLLAGRNQVPFADQMTPLQTIWGANYSRDRVAAMRHSLRGLLDPDPAAETPKDIGTRLFKSLKPFLDDQSLAGQMPIPDKENMLRQWQVFKVAKDAQAEEFRQYLRGWVAQVDTATPPFVQVSGYTKSERPTDLIHPNEAGHLCMAAALLKAFNADGLVSEIVLDAENLTVTTAKKAVVRELSLANGELSFRRLDESLPFPIDPPARPALALDTPSTAGTLKDLFELSRYITTVKNIPAGTYELAIDGEKVAMVTSDQLAHGFDAGLLDKGPVAAQTRRLLEAVRTNSLSVFNNKGEPNKVTVGGPKILAEAQPVEHKWTFTPIKTNRTKE